MKSALMPNTIKAMKGMTGAELRSPFFIYPPVVISFLFLVFPVHAENVSYSPKALALFEQRIEGIASQKEYDAGFILLLEQHGTSVSEFIHGPADGEYPIPVKSMSKWVSTSIILSLVNQGRMKTTDTLGQWVPAFRQTDKANITAKQIMAHVSGFPGYLNCDRPYPALCSNYAVLNTSLPEEALYASLAREPLAAPPATKRIYSDISFIGLRAMAEAATGEKWETLFKKNIAAPLAMKNASYLKNLFDRNPQPATSLSVRPKDYLKFIRIFSQQYCGNEDALPLSRENVRAITLPRFATLPHGSIFSTMDKWAQQQSSDYEYGYGLMMLTLKNENHPSIFLHPGAYGSLAIWDAGRDALLVFGFSGRETKSALPILQAYLELHHSVRLPKDAKPSSPADLCELQKVQAHPSTD